MSYKRNGWVKIVAIGCLIIVILLSAIGYFAYNKIKESGPKIIANIIEATSEGMLSELQIPQEESAKAMSVIKDFTLKIRNREVTIEQGKNVAKSLGSQSVMGAITMRSLEMTYVSPSSLSYQEKDAAKKTLTRVAYGLTESKITQAELDFVLKTINEEVSDDYGKKWERWKPFLTTEELNSFLSNLSALADKAGIEDKEFPYDIAETIKKAIEKGMNKPISN